MIDFIDIVKNFFGVKRDIVRTIHLKVEIFNELVGFQLLTVEYDHQDGFIFTWLARNGMPTRTDAIYEASTALTFLMGLCTGVRLSQLTQSNAERDL